MDNHTKRLRFEPFVLLFAICMLISVALDGTREDLRSGITLILLTAVLLGVWALRKSLPLNWITITIGLGILVKIAYILYTPVWCRQHDVIDFGAVEGHAAYIEYLLNNKALPDFDPRERWAFFQPPLHHIIAAVWMKIYTKFGIPIQQVRENVQVLTLFYTCSVTLFSYYIFKEFDLKKWGMRIACMIMAFSPVFILMSGSINNDALCIALQVAAIYFSIRWYKEPKLWFILLTAVCIGGSMMAKLSGGAVAPAVLAIFILKLLTVPVDDDTSASVAPNGFHIRYFFSNLKAYILQFVSFAIVCFPLGLWSPIRNKVLFDVPFNFTPPVGEGLEQYSLLQRLLDLRLNSVYPAMINNGDAYDEYNIFLALVKTSLFGEYNFGNTDPLVNPFAILLFIITVLLITSALIATLYFCLSRKSPLSSEWKIFWGVFYLTQVVVYFSFAFKQLYFSSQDFRYIAGILVPESLFLGMLADKLDPGGDIDTGISSKRRSLMFFTLLTCAELFALCSFCLYIGIGL